MLRSILGVGAVAMSMIGSKTDFLGRGANQPWKGAHRRHSRYKPHHGENVRYITTDHGMVRIKLGSRH